MGDNSIDQRRNYEYIYLFFNASYKKFYEHYRHLPKFVLEEYQNLNSKLSSFTISNEL